jgi:hypothetical protein
VVNDAGLNGPRSVRAIGEGAHLCVVNDGGETGRALRVGTGEDVHLCVVNDVVLNSGCNGSTTQCGLLVTGLYGSLACELERWCFLTSRAMAESRWRKAEKEIR